LWETVSRRWNQQTHERQGRTGVSRVVPHARSRGGTAKQKNIDRKTSEGSAQYHRLSGAVPIEWRL